MKTIIEVFSTNAIDILLNEKREIIQKSNGGPAYFIQKTLSKLSVEYLLNTTTDAVVEVLITKNTEVGRIVSLPEKNEVRPKNNNSFVLVSTLLKEWEIPTITNKLFIDIQGYVRDVKQFGEIKQFNFNPNVERSLVCVKAEESEANFLNNDFLQRQKNKQLVITKGDRGVDLYLAGKKYSIPTQKISSLPNTLGAGDTWFSSYVAYQSLGFSPLVAAKKAMIITSEFLKKKLEIKENL